MSRPIHFRYKVKGREGYLYDDDPEFGYLKRNRKSIAGSYGNIFFVEREEQFTGFFVENNTYNVDYSTRVYEGDSITVGDVYEQLDDKDDKPLYKGVVIWDEGGFCLHIKEKLDSNVIGFDVGQKPYLSEFFNIYSIDKRG